MIGQDGQQVLVKHGGSYVRVHPCHLLLEQAAFGQPMVDNQDQVELIKVQQSQTETNFESDKDDKVASDDQVNEQAMESENEELENLMSQRRAKEQNNEDLGQLENETKTNVAMEQASNQVTENSEHSNVPNKIIYISRGGKVMGKYRNHFNIHNIVNNSISCVDWDEDIHTL